MNPIKVAIAGILGVVTTLGLLFLMNSLVNTEFAAPDAGQTVKIPDIRMPDTKIEVRTDEDKPEKPQEPEAPPPDMPEPEFDTPEIGSEGLNMQVPLGDTGIEIGANALSFSEGEYLPIVKVPPEYPSTASSRGIEGFCTVVYTVTETGTTRDPQPIASECITKDGKPTTVFNRASVRAALKFKYKPKVVDGKAVEVSGVKNRFTYQLSQE